jgi:hypothetical protein
MTQILCGANRIQPFQGSWARVHGPELPDPRDLLFTEGKIAGFRPILPDGSISWLDLVTYRVQRYSSCVGWDLAQKCELASLIAFSLSPEFAPKPIDFPSPLFNYTRARLLGEKDLPRKDGDPLLVDWGSGCRWAMKAVRDTGLVTEAAWPESPETINRVPSADLFENGVVCTVEAFYRIPDGKTCLERRLPSPSAQIHDAMQRGYPPGGCMIVDEKYAGIGKATYGLPGGKILGGHCQTVVAHDVPGKRFGVLSTWGRDVGDEGIFWVSEDFVNHEWYDIWVVQSAPGEI